MIFLPITQPSTYRHEAGISVFVSSDLIFGRAVISQIVRDVFGEGGDQLRFAKANPELIAEADRPTVDALAERIEVFRDGTGDKSEVREI